MKPMTVLAAAAVLMLAGCNEFGPSEKVYTRAVRGPEEKNSAAQEYDGSTATGIPLITADFPANKDDTIHVHTAIDNARAATQPAATAPASVAPDNDVVPAPGHSTIDLTPKGTHPADH